MPACPPSGATVAPQVQGFRDAVTAASPALDSVEFWLTHAVRQDYELRGVFRDLCAEPASARNGSGWQLRFISRGQAEALIADCVQHAVEVRGGLLNAYRNHERRMRAALAEAAGRAALFESAEPMCVLRTGREERWIGTREQLNALGIQPLGTEAWPRETGRAGTKIYAKDARGYPASVSRSSNLWPRLFEVAIDLPRQQCAEPPPAQRQLSSLSPTQAVFRQRTTTLFEHFAIELRNLLRPEVGYRYSKEVIDEFMGAMAEAREALQTGTIVGRSRDQEIQHAAAQRAKDDAPLQAFLAGLRSLPDEPNA